jgi:hypothetical protein
MFVKLRLFIMFVILSLSKMLVKLIFCVMFVKRVHICELNAKFQNRRTTLTGRKVTGSEERRKRKNTINRDHYTLPATVHGQCSR